MASLPFLSPCRLMREYKERKDQGEALTDEELPPEILDTVEESTSSERRQFAVSCGTALAQFCLLMGPRGFEIRSRLLLEDFCGEDCDGSRSGAALLFW